MLFRLAIEALQRRNGGRSIPRMKAATRGTWRGAAQDGLGDTSWGFSASYQGDPHAVYVSSEVTRSVGVIMPSDLDLYRTH